MYPYFIFEITSECNSRCIYCYNVWKNHSGFPQTSLSLDEIKILLNQLLEDTKISGITLAGGEPLLHPHLWEILSFLKDRGIKTGIASNGILLDEGTILRLIQRGVSYFEISLDSIDPEMYRELTGVDGLKKVKQALLSLRKLRQNVTVSIIISGENYQAIPRVIDLCYAFSVKTIALNRYIPCPENNNPALEISTQQLKNILSMADMKSRNYNLPILVTIPVEACLIDHSPYSHLKFGTCSCGDLKWVIGPGGDLRACEQNPEILGNLLEESFTLLAQKTKVELFRENNLQSHCPKCISFNQCGGGCRFVRV